MKKLLIALMAAAVLASVSTAKADTTSFTVTVVNQSSYTIEYIQVQDAGAGNYSSDLLASDQTIAPGQSATIQFDEHRGYCTFNVAITTLSGDTSYLTDENFCQKSTLYVVNQ